MAFRLLETNSVVAGVYSKYREFNLIRRNYEKCRLNLLIR